MASLSYTHINGNYSASGTYDYTELDGAGTPGVLVIGTGSTTIDLSVLTTPEIAIITNHDDTKTIVFGVESGGSLIEVLQLGPESSIPQKLSPNATYMLTLKSGQTGTARVSFEAFSI